MVLIQYQSFLGPSPIILVDYTPSIVAEVPEGPSHGNICDPLLSGTKLAKDPSSVPTSLGEVGE